VLAAPLALFLVFRTAVDASAPALAASVPATSPSSQLRERARNVAHPNYKVDAETLEFARKAAAAEPLNYLPYFIAARAAEQSRDFPKAVQLMEEARRRNATWIPIRLYLVALYGRVNRVPEMIREIDFTLRVNETARFALLPELVKLLGRSDGRHYIDQLLASNPPWKRDLFTIARDRKISPDVAQDLLQRAARRGGDTSAERQLYVSALVSAGRGDVAREQWLAALPEAERSASRFIFNGDFSRPPTPGEFAWKVHALDVGRADIVDAGDGKRRLSTRYHGGRTAVLAEQQLALGAGSYRLQVTGRSQSNSGAAQLFWTIGCYPDGPEIARMPIEGFGAEDKTVAAQFRVAGSCRSQVIRLTAEPGELTAPTDAEFAEVRIDGAR
jgi:hypothetical protein